MNIWFKLVAGSIIAIMVIFSLSLVANPSFADDDEHYKYRTGDNDKGRYDDYYGEHGKGGHEKDGLLEEGGELLGWGTVIAIGGAGLIMPLRRGSRSLIKKFPNTKNTIISALKLVGKSHLWIGSLAILLGAIHGVLMYIDEGEFGFEGVTGTISVGLMAIAAIFGALLMKKRGNNQLRSIHLGFLIVAVLIGAVHVLIA
ncbi:MAG TPA: hypothetical protein GX497_16840 [Bacillus bacterium]|nr:hypothetical protein [Bacillus sp. (in: firmicutes)]